MSNMELELAIAKAIASPLVKTLGKDEVLKMITAGISHSAMVRGQDISLNGKSFIANEVYDEIFSKYTSLRVEEIPIVFRNGVYGKYGEYFGINALTIVSWFNAYLSSDERFNTIESEKKKQIESHKTAYTEDELKKMNHDASKKKAMSYYHEAKENEGKISGFVNVKAGVFDFLVSVGVIKNADQRISNALEEVKEEIRHKSKKMNRGINQINAVLEVAADMGDKSLVPQAKAMILDRFYKALYDTGRELHL